MANEQGQWYHLCSACMAPVPLGLHFTDPLHLAAERAEHFDVGKHWGTVTLLCWTGDMAQYVRAHAVQT